MIFFLHIKVTSCWHQRHFMYLKEVRNEHHFRKGSIFVKLQFSNNFTLMNVLNYTRDSRLLKKEYLVTSLTLKFLKAE